MSKRNYGLISVAVCKIFYSSCFNGNGVSFLWEGMRRGCKFPLSHAYSREVGDVGVVAHGAAQHARTVGSHIVAIESEEGEAREG